MAEIMRFDLARAVAAGLELGDARGVDIEPDHRRALAAEGDGDWQPDISEADDGELSTVRHDLTLMRPDWGGLSLPRVRHHPQRITQAVRSSRRR